MSADADPTVSELVELPRRVVKQPTPELFEGGDCGACVLAGLLNLSVEEVYAKLHKAGKPTPFSFDAMVEALRRAKYNLHLIDRFITRTPTWPVWDAMRAWGDSSWHQQMDWRDWLQMAFDAGYYAIAEVRHTHEPMVFQTDHWVLYAGLRTKWDSPERRHGAFEMLVSDSARTKPQEAWFDVGTHLKERGGFSVLLARPRANQRFLRFRGDSDVTSRASEW